MQYAVVLFFFSLLSIFLPNVIYCSVCITSLTHHFVLITRVYYTGVTKRVHWEPKPAVYTTPLVSITNNPRSFVNKVFPLVQQLTGPTDTTFVHTACGYLQDIIEFIYIKKNKSSLNLFTACCIRY